MENADTLATHTRDSVYIFIHLKHFLSTLGCCSYLMTQNIFFFKYENHWPGFCDVYFGHEDAFFFLQKWKGDSCWPILFVILKHSTIFFYLRELGLVILPGKMSFFSTVSSIEDLIILSYFQIFLFFFLSP